MPCLPGNGQRNIDRRITISSSRYVSRANERLAFAVPERIALRVVKKFYSESCTRCAVQTALNVSAGTTTDRGCEHGIILQIIRPGIEIAIVIRVDAVGVAVKLQVDPEAGIRENGVAKNGVVD